ncbi:hypothetical protein F2Q68_00016525 [Brassica cretica]|uniref:Uncharacterized protein n=1 Tax=Brassica cretica TaxID=69181 RepID=A0A8S9HQ42_BRACR|nr:hypothetical protein F2Q68_00016525 [Brassica cretica]
MKQEQVRSDIEGGIYKDGTKIDCSFGPTRRAGKLDYSFGPTRPFGDLDWSNSPSGRVELPVRSNSPLRRVGRASSLPRWQAGLIEPYARFIFSTPWIRLSRDSSNLSRGLIV